MDLFSCIYPRSSVQDLGHLENVLNSRIYHKNFCLHLTHPDQIQLAQIAYIFSVQNKASSSDSD